MATSPIQQAQAKARRAREHMGRWGEYWAILYLLLRGYRLLALRFQTHVCEVDLIASRAQTLCLIEVKTRTGNSAPHEAVSAAQIDRLKRAAQEVQASGFAKNMTETRLDLILVRPRKLHGPWHLQIALWPAITHIKGAFDARQSRATQIARN